MKREEARERAERFVYCDCNLGDILDRCELAGIETKKKNGKCRSRSALETDLIDFYSVKYGGEK